MSKRIKKNKKKNKRKNWDKISFEKREKIRSKLKKERVYTKSFRTQQSFGAASEVRYIDINSFLKENPQYEEKQ